MTVRKHAQPSRCAGPRATLAKPFKQSKQEVQVTTFWSILIEVVSNTTAGKGVKVRTRQIEAKV